MRKMMGTQDSMGVGSLLGRRTSMLGPRARGTPTTHTQKQRGRTNPWETEVRDGGKGSQIKTVVNYLTKAATAYSNDPEPRSMRHKRKQRLITAPEYHTFNNRMSSIAGAALSGTMTVTAALVRTLDELERARRKRETAHAAERGPRPGQTTGRELVTKVREWQHAHPFEAPTPESRNAHRLLSQQSKGLPSRQEIEKTLHRCRLQLVR